MSARRRVPGAPSFCSIAAILPSRPARATCRRAQRRSRMARLRATAPAARSVLDGREHDGSLHRVGAAISHPTNKPSKGLRERPSKNELTLTLSSRANRTADFLSRTCSAFADAWFGLGLAEGPSRQTGKFTGREL